LRARGIGPRARILLVHASPPGIAARRSGDAEAFVDPQGIAELCCDAQIHAFDPANTKESNQ
jgi:hypothetical protein